MPVNNETMRLVLKSLSFCQRTFSVIFFILYYSQANSQNKTMHESGTHLAARALGIATVITTMSLGALALFVCYIIKPSDQNNFDGRTQSIFPSRCK
ncbi:Protein Chibby isoform 2 [Schistosoma japonicum]|uniref:Protein Chibby isoform 2 n=1 Tax=Schistosoma japonicum TaxID=6182 RepID=A0A4Z2D8V6_SCHJA|nr:Protein Chibby isoform 2 [Schistosoma japonicum]